jgi:ribosome-binding ATPase YchF (GTP1/OBG family)
VEASNILIGVVGKTNVGKSTFFSAATEIDVEIENRPFTTIDPNLGVTYVRKRCVHVKLGLPRCDASNSLCIDGYRYIPVKIMDVAGLVPGAHEGKGLGNKFLDHLRRADVLLLVVDASGSTSPEGIPVKPGTYDPVDEVHNMIKEIEEWMFNIIRKDWDRFARGAESSGSPDVAGLLAQRLSGLSVKKSHVVYVLEKTGLANKRLTSWTKDDLRLFVSELRKVSKPIVVVANKIDIPEAEENVKRLKSELKDMIVIPTSAASELILRKASKLGLIRYRPGDNQFTINDTSKLDKRRRALLEAIEERVLKKWGSTGVQEVINTAVLKVLNMIAVYPVDDVNKYTDSKGRILPDVLLVPKGTTARELAYKIHTDLGRTFLYAINAISKQRVGESYELKDDDVIKIVASAGRK